MASRLKTGTVALARPSTYGTWRGICLYQWLLTEVYDPRFPHIGDDRHGMNGRNFNSLRYGGDTHARLTEFHQKRGWLNCRHKPLIRLWVEWKAMQ